MQITIMDEIVKKKHGCLCRRKSRCCLDVMQPNYVRETYQSKVSVSDEGAHANVTQYK